MGEIIGWIAVGLSFCALFYNIYVAIKTKKYIKYHRDFLNDKIRQHNDFIDKYNKHFPNDKQQYLKQLKP